MASDEPAPAAPPPAPRARWQLLWLFAGSAATLVIVVVLRLTQPEAPPPAPSATRAAEPAPAALGSAGAQFAELYLAYLLRSYYVDSRGFCKKLLDAICAALLHSDLLAPPSSCYDLPNEALVLAIGRYQHQVGLPVDGKAGPETVRMILGGDFANRREMAARYCPGVAIDGPVAAPATSWPQAAPTSPPPE